MRSLRNQGPSIGARNLRRIPRRLRSCSLPCRKGKSQGIAAGFFTSLWTLGALNSRLPESIFFISRSVPFVSFLLHFGHAAGMTRDIAIPLGDGAELGTFISFYDDIREEFPREGSYTPFSDQLYRSAFQPGVPGTKREGYRDTQFGGQGYTASVPDTGYIVFMKSFHPLAIKLEKRPSR